MDRRVADDAMVRAALADLELGLDQGDDRATGGRGAASTRRAQDERERDERHVDDGQVDRLAERLGGQRPGVRPIVDDDARVPGEPSASWPRPTSTAWTRAAPRWSRTSVKPPVEAPRRGRQPRRVDPERVERGRELVTAAADVRVLLREAHRERRLDEIARLPVQPARRRRRPTRTLPARISAWARARVSARPRSTRSWSSRWRGGVRWSRGSPGYRGTAAFAAAHRRSGPSRRGGRRSDTGRWPTDGGHRSACWRPSSRHDRRVRLGSLRGEHAAGRQPVSATGAAIGGELAVYGWPAWPGIGPFGCIGGRWWLGVASIVRRLAMLVWSRSC